MGRPTGEIAGPAQRVGLWLRTPGSRFGSRLGLRPGSPATSQPASPPSASHAGFGLSGWSCRTMLTISRPATFPAGAPTARRPGSTHGTRTWVTRLRTGRPSAAFVIRDPAVARSLGTRRARQRSVSPPIASTLRLAAGSACLEEPNWNWKNPAEPRRTELCRTLQNRTWKNPAEPNLEEPRGTLQNRTWKNPAEPGRTQ